MSYSGETNEQCCLTPLDSARYIMERARHVQINLSSLHKLANTVNYFSFIFFFLMKICVKISSAMMDGECTSDDWIGSDVGPRKGDTQLTIDWFE
jgi:hypothetical protein